MQIGLRRRILAAILVLGAYAQAAQAMLVREALVVFRGNEGVLGLFFACWLLWVAVGSLLAGRMARAWRPLNALWWLLAGSLPVLVVQLFGLRLVRPVFDLSPTELLPVEDQLVALLIVMAPGGLLLGLAFPLACRALQRVSRGGRPVGQVAGLYIADALGALAGGLLFTLALVTHLGPSGSIAVLSLVVVAGLALLLRPPRRPFTCWLLVISAAAALVVALTPLRADLDRRLEARRFAALHPGLVLVQAFDTRYGHVAIARLGEQTSVLRDGSIAETFPQPQAVARDAAYVLAQAPGAQRLLLFGGAATGLVGELLGYPVEAVDLVEQDRRAFERVRRYLPPAERKALQDPRLRLFFGDGRAWLNGADAERSYDLVLALQGDPSSAYGNRLFTVDFYRRVAARLADGGVFCTRVGGAANYLGTEVAGYTASVYATLRAVFAQVALVPGDQQTYCAATTAGRVSEDAAELARRYRAAQSPGHFPADGFYSLLDPARLRLVHHQFDQHPGEVNRDSRPVAYFLNMLLWGRYSDSASVELMQGVRRMGAWPWLLPVGLLVGLWLLRAGFEGSGRVLSGFAPMLALASLGGIAMAAQLLVLFAYQARVGFVFERVALLNGVFMTGLALGAWGGRALSARDRANARASVRASAGSGASAQRRSADTARLAVVLGLVALAMALLPVLLDGLAAHSGVRSGLGAAALLDLGYVGVSVGIGLLTGVGFPIGFALLHADQRRLMVSSGLVQAADNLGGALGALLTGALLVPILGFATSSRLLAGLALVALLPLVVLGWAPPRWSFGRATPSAWWGIVAWPLLWLVLLAFAWMQLQGLADRPQVRFQEARLQALLPVVGVAEYDDPFVHYLASESGEGGDQQPVGSIALVSTLAAAPEVRGYAGPLNLLLAVDAGGRLRRVQYLDSNETPAYIHGIDHWLAGLSGEEMARQGLTLDRVDALSGATVTSQAALAAINRTVRRVGQVAFGDRAGGWAAADRQGSAASAAVGSAWRSPGLWVVGLLMLLFFPVYLSGSERGRLWFQAAALAVLGLWLNSLVTEVDLANLSLGHWPDLATNPLRWLLLAFVLVSALLFGQVWCGYFCPFGALQEFISRLGRALRLRRYPDRPLDTLARFTKYLLLAGMLVAVWLSGDPAWVGFNPMQLFFGWQWQGWMLALTLLVLLAALLYYRFWCRYLCPFGALLALSNKVALLHRLAPKRRFNHCDLGVRGEFDVDCIRCNRCLTGTDTRLRPPRRNHAGRRPV